MAKNGILLANFGGPQNLAEVKPFLKRLFSDQNILVDLPPSLRYFFALLISSLKHSSSRKNYQSIGGSSPILHWTTKQAQGLEPLLNNQNGRGNSENNGDGDQYKVEVGMTLSQPFIKEALDNLLLWKADRIIVLPLFPQYSTTTTKSVFDAADRYFAGSYWRPEIIKLESWFDNSNYICLLKQMLLKHVHRLHKISKEPIHLLFSAHSLPMKFVERGDLYPTQIKATVNAIMQDFDFSWSLAFQSRNGSTAWLRPYMEEEIPRLAEAGKRSLLVIPISFVCDHVETLYELDQFYFQLAKQHGVIHYERLASFNDMPEFFGVLCSIIHDR